MFVPEQLQEKRYPREENNEEMKAGLRSKPTTTKLTSPLPAIRMYSYRPVSGLMSGFPAKSPSHTLVQWLFDLALALLVKSGLLTYRCGGSTRIINSQVLLGFNSLISRFIQLIDL